MRTIRTTGHLILRFEENRRAAEDWVRGLRRTGRPALHLAPPGSPLGSPPPRGPVGIFPGSFDPTTAAHAAMARAALARGPVRSIIITFDLGVVDKARHEASLAERIALACVAFRKDPRIGIGVSTHGMFLEKVQAVRRARLGRRGIYFVVGTDTMKRVLHPRYYRRPARDIPRLLGSARFIVFPRGGALPAAAKIARLIPLPLPRRLQALSSSRLRRSIRSGRVPLGNTPNEVLYCIRERGLYTRRRPPPAGVVTSFLLRGGRLLILKRSDLVGSYAGAWAGVSGYVDWPLTQIPQILTDRISGGERRRQTLRQAYKEIREETGLGRSSLLLLRRHSSLRLPARDRRRDWVIDLFLFRLRGKGAVRLDWEHTEGRWIWPEEIENLSTVPRLAKSLRLVLPRTRQKRSRGSFSERAAAIARDPKGGAMEILSLALDLLEEVAEYGPIGAEAFERQVLEVGAGLLSGHPMAPLENLVDAMRGTVRDGSGARGLGRSVERIRRLAETGSERVLRDGLRAVGKRRRIATYSYSSAVVSLIRSIGRRRDVEVIVVGDPGGHGRRLSRQVRREGVAVRPIARRIHEDADGLLLGADAIYGKTVFLNARGTGRVVDQARRLDLPIWVLGHPLKLRRRRPRRLPGRSFELISSRGVRILGAG